MARKGKGKGPEVRISTFVRGGHRSHTNWARFVRTKRVQTMLEDDERRLNLLYVCQAEPESAPGD